MRLAYGYGMRPIDFLQATDRDVINWIAGHQMLQWERSEDMWNASRHIMHAVNLAHMKKTDNVKPSDFIQLHMDGEPKGPDPYVQQKIREISDLWDSIPFSDPSEYDDNIDAILHESTQNIR